MKFLKDKMLLIIALILILGGIIVFMYPTVSNYLAEKNQAEVIHEYNDAVAELDEETIEEELEKAQTYNENLSGDPVHDPFVEGSGYALPDDYTDVLNISGNGVMAYIEIPEISVYLPIYHGTDDEVLEKGVGHIQQTSLPIGGSSTHCVLTGHTGLPNAELFTRIDELEVGDTFYIYVLNQTLKYEIYETEVIEPEDISELTIEDGRDLITLVTCTPYGVNTHRLLVKAERTEYNEEEEQELIEEESQNSNKNIKLYIIGIAIGLIVILIAMISIHIAKKKKRKIRKKR